LAKAPKGFFTKKFVVFPILTPETPKNIAQETLFGLRKLKLTPWDVKNWEYTHKLYKDFCESYIFCNVCKVVDLKENMSCVSPSIYICAKKECEAEKDRLLERKRSIKKEFWNNADLSKLNLKKHKLKPLDYYLNKNIAQIKSLKGLTQEDLQKIIEHRKKYNICKKCGGAEERAKGSIIWNSFYCAKCATNIGETGIISDRINSQKEKYREKTGYYYPSQNPEIKKLKSEKYFEKTGYHNPSQNPEIKNKKIKIYLEKYGVSNPNYIPEVKEKRKITMLERYGVEFYSQTDKCKEIIRNSLDKISKISHDDILKYTEDIKNGIYTVNFIEFMKKENLSWCTVRKLLRTRNIKYRTTTTGKSKPQEKLFEDISTSEKIRNDREVIRPQELDIYLPEIRLGIEYNGLHFHSQGVSKYSMFNNPDFDKNYHLNKTLACAAKGIQLFHIFEGENLDLWLSMIHNKLGLNTKVYARKCTVKEIKNFDTKDFQNENHIRGFCAASKCFGLFYNDKLMSIMTFGKPRFNKNYEYELIRFCTLRNHTIIGGASKLWKYFLKKYAPKSVVSYANLRFSNGGIYEKLGFSKVGQSPPNYFYFKDSNILESGNKFQKHKLANLHYSGVLPHYDENGSETEIMFANGYRRIFDCGNLIYEFLNDSNI
jgi:hypothetical protein